MSEWPRPVVHFQIHAKDPAKQQAFYQEMFEWDISSNGGMTVIGPGKGPPEEGLSGTMMQTEHAPALTFYVQVAKLGESLQQAERLGGKVVMQALDVPNGPTVAQITDPEGNLLGLVQM